ncbi:MAG TPA: pilus assembly protein PilP [Candidatus Deferrimicrobiaceae bacterium]|jgi:Tfp pilus assembly protein PilP
MRRNCLRLPALLMSIPFLVAAYSGCAKEENVANQPIVRKAVPKKTAEAVAAHSGGDNTVAVKAAEAPAYNPAGKRDPFMPFLRPVVKVPVTVEVPTGPPTLLTQDLGAFKYVGMIWTPRAVRGLVEDVDGKGYTVTVGSHLGRGGAVVTRINDKEIVVKESSRDYAGAEVVRETSLKLKSAGGKR